MSRFLTVLLALAFLVGTTPLGFFPPAQAQQSHFTICPNGVIISSLPCPFVVQFCNDGTKIPGDIGDKKGYCASRGGTKGFEPVKAPTVKCPNGTTIPTTIVAKGMKAIQTFCTGAAAGTAM